MEGLNLDENVEEIIHELISIEEQCAEVTKRVNEESAGFNSRLDEEKRKINAATDARIAEEIRIINAAAIEETRVKMIEASAQSQKLFAIMERDYEDNSEQWADEIFRLITEEEGT